MMKTFCTAARLKSLLKEERMPKMKEFIQIFEKCFPASDAYHGSLLYDVLTMNGRDLTHATNGETETKMESRVDIDLETINLLQDCLNRRRPAGCNEQYCSSMTRGEGLIPLQPTGYEYSKYQIGGTWYRPAVHGSIDGPRNRGSHAAHKDSHVMVAFPGECEPVACSIQSIFGHRHKKLRSEENFLSVFMVIRRYENLEESLLKHDPWRCYPRCIGRLYYDALAAVPEIITVSEIVSHFAKTPFPVEDFPDIGKPTIHVLPLSWVSNRAVAG
jgi:hypothetical protein